MPEKDPLSQIVDTLASMIEGSSAIKQAMGLARKNIHAYNKLRGDTKSDVTSESDLPEIIIETTGGPSNINLGSNACQMMFACTISVNSGEMRITSALHPVLFAIWSTLAAGLTSSPLTALQWNNESFCKKYEFVNIQTAKANPELNRGIIGWVAICTVQFHLVFSKTNLAVFVQGG